VIVEVPTDKPVNVPLTALINTDVLLLLQAPPVESSVRVTDPVPLHICKGPVIGAGSGFTVMIMSEVQPTPREYVMSTSPPDRLTPVTMPVDEPAVAMPASLLLHVPPPGAASSSVADPAHTADAPSIAPGCAFTVTTSVAAHTPGPKLIVEVPGLRPVTTPDGSIVATAVLLLLHVPSVLVSVNVMLLPWQIIPEPVIVSPEGFTRTVAVTLQPAAVVKVTVALPLPCVATVPLKVSITTTEVSLLLHVPPPGLLVSVVPVPWHSVVAPLMPPG
jgi:hypothetical protein